MKIDKDKARQTLIDASKAENFDPIWVDRIEKISQLCEAGLSKTHLAFLGTAILAKAVEPKVNLLAIKPRLLPEEPFAYSARSLCHGVLVPLSAELDFDIGVRGREPLNNQPYFRMSYLGDQDSCSYRRETSF